MPPLKKNKVVKEEKTTEEQKIQAVINSQYHFMIPMVDAAFIKVRNPVTGLDHHFSTSDNAFFEMLFNLSQKGMKNKIFKDFDIFAERYDSKWAQVSNEFQNYILNKETSNA